MNVTAREINQMGEPGAASPEADAPTSSSSSSNPFTDKSLDHHGGKGWWETSPERTASSYAIGRDGAGSRKAQRNALPGAGYVFGCEGCGDEYKVKNDRPDQRRRRLCPSCRGTVGVRKLAEQFTTPDSTKAERIRANGLVNKRLKLGWFARPKACQKCGRTDRRLDTHHADYSRPDEVLFLCRGCHMGGHRDPATLAGLKPVALSDQRTVKSEPHRSGGRKGTNGKPKVGRHPLRRILAVVTGYLGKPIAIEHLTCGHTYTRDDDGHRPGQRRCPTCPVMPSPAPASREVRP